MELGTHLGRSRFGWEVWFVSLLLLGTISWLSCHHGPARQVDKYRGRIKRILDEFTVRVVNASDLNYNHVVLCSSDGELLNVISENVANGEEPVAPGLVKLEEGNTYYMELVFWEVMDQPVIRPTFRVYDLNDSEYRVWSEPCHPGGDSLALLWSHGAVKSRIYRSEDIVGLHVRVRD